jgi:hypothetical protein
MSFSSFSTEWISPHRKDFMEEVTSSTGKNENFLDPRSISKQTEEPDIIQANVRIIESNIESENTTVGRIYKDQQLIVVCHDLMVAIEKSHNYGAPLVFSRETFQDHADVCFVKWEAQIQENPNLRVVYQQYLDDVADRKCDVYGKPYVPDGKDYTAEWEPTWVYTKPHLMKETHYVYGALNGDSEMMEGRNDGMHKIPKGLRTFFDSTQLRGRKEMRHRIDTNYWQNGKLTLYFLQFDDGVDVTHEHRLYPLNPIVTRIECSSRYQYRLDNEKEWKPYPYSYPLGSVFFLDEEMVVKNVQIGPSKKNSDIKVTLTKFSDENYKRNRPVRVNQYY